MDRDGTAAGTQAGGWRDEAAMVAAWFAAAPRHLLLADGRLASVVFRGHPGHGPGPDIRSAILALPDGRLLHGDVEAHRSLADWDRHGHAGDPHYRGVILHLLAEPPPVPVHDGIPAAAWDPPEVPWATPAAPAAGTPCPHGPARPDPGPWLDAAASARVASRGHSLEATAADQGTAQAAWEAVLTVLGSGPARPAWDALAREFPVTALPALARSRPTGAPDPDHLASRMLARLPAAAWRGHPAGHPRHRIPAAARLGLALEQVLALPLDGTTPARLRALAGTGLGPDRATQLAASVLLPLALARGAPLPEPVPLLLARWPLRRPPGVVRRLAARLGQPGPPLPVPSAREEQALLWQRDHGCHRAACWDCPLP